MSDLLEDNTLERWQREPISFLEEVLHNPETGKPFELFDAERQFLKHAWETREDGRLRYPEQCFGAIKKTGKTGLAGCHVLTTTLVYGGPYAEGYCVANDFEQAQGRVFEAIRKICECSPLLQRECEITASRIRVFADRRGDPSDRFRRSERGGCGAVYFQLRRNVGIRK